MRHHKHHSTQFEELEVASTRFVSEIYSICLQPIPGVLLLRRLLLRRLLLLFHDLFRGPDDFWILCADVRVSAMT